MSKKEFKEVSDYIVPLNINGLEGRMLHIPAPKTKQAQGNEILFVYGHHSSLERWYGLALVMNRFGSVTVPDLPGFGGMDSFYKIHKKPTLDNMADYLAAFIKLKYRRKKVSIVGLSFGFIVVTRMLQRYPELTRKVTFLVSIVGFAHHDDFTFSRKKYYFFLYGTRAISHKIPSIIFRYTALSPVALRTFYRYTPSARFKYQQIDNAKDFANLQDMEVKLWHDNDVRTWAYTTAEFLKFDNCKVRVNLPVFHVTTKHDNFFDNNVVEQHMRIIFSEYRTDEIDIGGHTPGVLATEQEASKLFPASLRRYILKTNK